jgi:hypothetical protein
MDYIRRSAGKSKLERVPKEEIRRIIQAEETVLDIIDEWYSTFFVRVPPDIISLQLCTPKVVGT